MPSPKSSFFRIVVTKNQDSFLKSFDRWYKNHSACERIWIDGKKEDPTDYYIIEFSADKTYQNFCELLKNAMKEHTENAPEYKVSIEKGFSNGINFLLLYQKDKSLLAPLKEIEYSDKVIEETIKIMSDKDLMFRTILKFILYINERLESFPSKYCCTFAFQLYKASLCDKVQPFLISLLEATIVKPFTINYIDSKNSVLSNIYNVQINYVYGIQPSSTKAKLHYSKDFTPEELLDFHNRVIDFAKENCVFPKDYAYPYKQIAEINEKISGDFNSEEHKILKVLEEKKTGLNTL